MTRLATCNNIPRFQALVNHYFHFFKLFSIPIILSYPIR
ncbi:hypothetical protein OG1X_0001 [Enterococcus faecalis OG1X]|nr:hypothetical protein OG1X_0001 [Enterococcus faecalis OG1X]